MRHLFILFSILTCSVHANTSTLIIDTGNGLATVTRFPNGEIMVYDTGHWTQDIPVAEAIEDFMGEQTTISLLVASHSDSDHIAATDELFQRFQIDRVLRTGFYRDTATWGDHDEAINSAEAAGLTHDVNLSEVSLPHGTQYKFGDATVTFLSGFHRPPASWDLHDSEYRNGNSIVLRMEYQGHSLLFTGDAVGRVEGSPQDAEAIATERYLIDNNSTRPIASTVLLVPHHGSDDASSKEFIESVAARWVIFPAGRGHEHPKSITAERYLSLGYSDSCLLRTDLGDDEGDNEWDFGRIEDHKDKVRDDTIKITFPSSGDPIVQYQSLSPIQCPIVIQPPAPTELPTEFVKKSRSGICHSPGSAWYARTKKFERFSNLEKCLASGGRLPK